MFTVCYALIAGGLDGLLGGGDLTGLQVRATVLFRTGQK